MANSISFIDVFSGIGIATLALREEGWQCHGAIESNKNARKVYQQNTGIIPFGDIEYIQQPHLPPVDVYFISPPMSVFSRSRNAEINYYTGEFVKFFSIFDLIAFHSPRVVIIEMLANVTSKNKGEHLHLIHKALIKLNYNISYYSLKAHEFGIPLMRHNLYAIATHCDYSPIELNPPSVIQPSTIKEVLSGIPIDPALIVQPEKYHLVKASDRGKVHYCGYLKKGKLASLSMPTKVPYGKIPQCCRIVQDTGLHPSLLATEAEWRYYVYRSEQKIVTRLSAAEIHALAGIPDTFIPSPRKTASCTQLGQASSYPLVKFIAQNF